MSHTFIYNPEPGITYDIIRMLYVKLNPVNTWKEKIVSTETIEKDSLYITKQAELLPDPSPDLLLFFFIPANKKGTFMSRITDKLISTDFSSLSYNLPYAVVANTEKDGEIVCE